jgi:hypothetical protein
VHVELAVEGEPRVLPAGADLAAYRVIQEALTNVLRHAGTDHCRVRLDYRASPIVIEVSDDGHGAGPPEAGGGHGLIGMRERLAVYGGRLTAGPGDDGGFRVTAELPVPGDEGGFRVTAELPVPGDEGGFRVTAERPVPGDEGGFRVTAERPVPGDEGGLRVTAELPVPGDEGGLPVTAERPVPGGAA